MVSSRAQPPEHFDIEIAPNGDLVLVLENANAPFAVFDEPAAPPPSTSADAAQPKPPPPPSSARFLVSSNHLKLASPVFSAALTGPWSESVPARDGRHQITAEDWDVEALTIVLNVVHGRNYRVPKMVTLELLCKISVLVDYYRLHEAMWFPRSLWLNELRALVPRTYGRELVLWLCVSWVFEDNDIFKAVTKTAIRESTGPVSALGLPISAVVIGTFYQHVCQPTYVNQLYLADKINRRREETFARLKTFLEDLQTGFLEGTKGCSFECQSILLGALIKKLVASGLLERGPGCYFKGMSVAKAASAVQALQPPDTLKWRKKDPAVPPLNNPFQARQPSGGLFPAQQPSASPFPAQQPSAGIFSARQPSPSLFPTQQPSAGLFQTQQPSGGLFATRQPLQKQDSVVPEIRYCSCSIYLSSVPKTVAEQVIDDAKSLELKELKDATAKQA